MKWLVLAQVSCLTSCTFNLPWNNIGSTDFFGLRTTTVVVHISRKYHYQRDHQKAVAYTYWCSQAVSPFACFTLSALDCLHNVSSQISAPCPLGSWSVSIVLLSQSQSSQPQQEQKPRQSVGHHLSSCRGERFTYKGISNVSITWHCNLYDFIQRKWINFIYTVTCSKKKRFTAITIAILWQSQHVKTGAEEA